MQRGWPGGVDAKQTGWWKIIPHPCFIEPPRAPSTPRNSRKKIKACQQ